MKLELIFKILAVIFIGVTVVFLWQQNKDGTFISAVLGAVCFFLSFRFQTRERLKLRETETQNDADSGKV
jgi:1,4-dihydroxy-2-naphthoate octaprenyltransferase